MSNQRNEIIKLEEKNNVMKITFEDMQVLNENELRQLRLACDLYNNYNAITDWKPLQKNCVNKNQLKS